MRQPKVGADHLPSPHYGVCQRLRVGPAKVPLIAVLGRYAPVDLHVIFHPGTQRLTHHERDTRAGDDLPMTYDVVRAR